MPLLAVARLKDLERLMYDLEKNRRGAVRCSTRLSDQAVREEKTAEEKRTEGCVEQSVTEYRRVNKLKRGADA